MPPGLVVGEDPEQDKLRGFRVTDKGVVLITQAMIDGLSA